MLDIVEASVKVVYEQKKGVVKMLYIMWNILTTGILAVMCIVTLYDIITK